MTRKKKKDPLDNIIQIPYSSTPKIEGVEDVSSTPSPSVPKASKKSVEPKNELGLWLRGLISMPPEELKSALSDVNDKTTWVVAFNMVSHLGRISSLFGTLEKIENVLYSDESLAKCSTQELLKLHKNIHENLLTVLEFSRKFIAQNQEVLLEMGKSRDELIEVVRHLDKNVLQSLRDALRGI